MSASEVAGTVLTTIGVLGGAAVIVFALAAWLGKVWANRILESDRAKYASALEALRTQYLHETERLRSELAKTLHVSRVQFETEFKAMSDIWRAVVDVRASISELRPIGLRIVPRGQNEEEALNQRFQAYGPRLKVLVQVVHQNSPFYSKDLYAVLVELTKVANAEFTDLALGDHGRLEDWYDRGVRNREQVMAAAERISDLIRLRIERLSVVRE